MSIQEDKDIRDYMWAYAHICSGEYEPIDFKRGVEDFFKDPENNCKSLKEILKRYKRFCNERRFPFFCIALMPWAKEEYYRESIKIVEDFEAKHKELFD